MELNKLAQVLDNEVEPVVIGGMVLDINATPYMAANPGTTTPGKVLNALGGVGRNVAECMSKLGTKPHMISATGFDWAGNMLLEAWLSAGLSIEGIRRNQDTETAVVCNIFDGKGELAAAVASVEAIEKYLTPEWILKFKSNIRSAPVLMVDANLAPIALAASCKIAAEYGTNVWFEPVSVAKSARVASIAKYITITSPNEDELISMANALSHGDKFSPIQRESAILKFSAESSFQNLKPPIWTLLKEGIQVVIVTLGANGIFLCFNPGHSPQKLHFTRNQSSFSRKLYQAISLSCPVNRILDASKFKGRCLSVVHFPALDASVVRLTGAGDCLVGGTIASICAGLDIMQSVAVGIAAAKGAVETYANVPKEYHLAKISADACSIYSHAKVIFCESKM